jgi:uncharacterized membrane protein
MTRPRIKIELTVIDKAVEIIGWIALLTIWVLVISSYSNLPDTIPTHYNGVGKADGFGSKTIILIFPLIATIFFVGMTILNKFPYIFNYPTKITVENALRQYTSATRLLRYMKLILVTLFGIIAFKTIQGANGKSFGLGVWFLPLTMGLIFIPLTYFITKLFRTK